MQIAKDNLPGCGLHCIWWHFRHEWPAGVWHVCRLHSRSQPMGSSPTGTPKPCFLSTAASPCGLSSGHQHRSFQHSRGCWRRCWALLRNFFAKLGSLLVGMVSCCRVCWDKPARSQNTSGFKTVRSCAMSCWRCRKWLRPWTADCQQMPAVCMSRNG